MNTELACYIDDAWEPPALTLDAWLHDANQGTRLAPQAAAAPEAVERALKAAVAADSGDWPAASPRVRAEALEAIAAALERRSDAMAEADAVTTGVVIGTTALLSQFVPHAFRSAAAQVLERSAPGRLPGPHGDVEIRRLPLGPAAVIAPWNAPSVIAAHKVASALAAGCPVILKPSEHAPLSCQLLAEAIAELGLPRAAFQLVHGGPSVGAALVGDARIRAVSYTGGLAGGRAVAAACARDLKPVQLELGGNNPLVALAGADVDAVADGAVAALTTMNGQWCRALGRLLVHAPLLPAVLEGVKARLARLTLGSSLERTSDMGPMAHVGHRDAVRAAIDELAARGGRVHQVTALPALAGWFVPPTLVTGVAAAEATDEIFGPVATVHAFDDDGEALALANGTPYGLAAYVYGPEDRALALGGRIRAGGVKINGVGLTSLHPSAPRPAWGLSGLGDEGARETFELFRGHRVIGVAGRP